MRLIGYMFRRLLEMIPVLLGITLLAFIFMQLLPGDPITILTGGKASPETVAALRARYGLDKPVYIQYLRFLANSLRGDLGTSILQTHAGHRPGAGAHPAHLVALDLRRADRRAAHRSTIDHFCQCALTSRWTTASAWAAW